jgi:glycosyltransferase involved in cell wall biosynthesis
MRIAVVSTSIPYHAENFARNLKNAGMDATLLRGNILDIDWKLYDVVWSVGNFLSANIDVFYDIVKKKNPNIKIVVHWCGTDLLQLAQFTTNRKKCVRCVLENVDLHVADNVNFQKEFYQLTGLNAGYVTLIPEVPLDLKPLPEKFAVACYVPNERADFYRYVTIIDTARQMPDVEFLFFRTEGKATLPNCQFLGWVKDKQKFDLYERCSVALSIPQHGSLGVWVIELLQMGRRAITSEQHPYCLRPEDPKHIISLLSDLKEKVSPDEEASKFYQEEYSLKRQIELVQAALKKLD